jgi:hypothetical protein
MRASFTPRLCGLARCEVHVMSDDKPTIFEEMERDELNAERKLKAIVALQDLIKDFNAIMYNGMVPIEESLLYTLVLQMAMSANEHTGEETFNRDFLISTVKSAVNDGKAHIERARRDGVLPRPVNILKPGGGVH